MSGPPGGGLHDVSSSAPESDCSAITLEKSAVARRYVGGYYGDMFADTGMFQAKRLRPIEKKVALKDFELMAVIGRGAFGEVRLCRRQKRPDKVMAMKRLHKQHMVNRNQVAHVRAERDVLVESGNRQKNPWITDLYYSFQDRDHLYLVMEFLPGGDLMTWLIKYDVFDETVAQFYVAELILAVHSIHKMRYAHRDIKPDNILLDREGHIKLTDFGLCKQIDVSSIPVEDMLTCEVKDLPEVSNKSCQDKKATWKDIRNRKMFYTAVGSPGYVAPEVLMKQGYSMDCDWWSVGIILYEMLCGYPPFYADDVMQTCHKIIKWREYLDFPPDGADALSEGAVEMIKELLCDPEERLSFESILSNKFFHGINWNDLRNQLPPFVPQLRGDDDTRYFDVPDEDPLTNPLPQGTKDTNYLFYGFTAKLNVNSTVVSKTKSRPPIPDEFRQGMSGATEDENHATN
eukprot:TRINITY_DN12828_c0_g4_i1.p1 TRINITY_DN12828_c0_g4~~TRINITY_DN12828_c0_g4_i1.p1  ORF type:complete len:459 (+),score=171.37 TRINITY_DN12828_c0_g4_i1:148-1524(+)